MVKNIQPPIDWVRSREFHALFHGDGSGTVTLDDPYFKIVFEYQTTVVHSRFLDGAKIYYTGRAYGLGTTPDHAWRNLIQQLNAGNVDLSVDDELNTFKLSQFATTDEVKYYQDEAHSILGRWCMKPKDRRR